jgi:ADP-dependent NAD(P)H-hydrate dehydratase
MTPTQYMYDDTATGITLLTTGTLRDWALPMPSPDGDKEERGRVLIIGGSSEMPGAVILAACAALRAGAGKLSIATGASVAKLVALAIPESRVIGLPETANGGITAEAAHALDGLAEKNDAILIGPGMQDESAICGFVRELLSGLGDAKVILDACAMGIVRDAQEADETPGHASGGNRHDARTAGRQFLARFAAQVLLTPHAGEMAHLSGAAKDAIAADPSGAARDAARRWNAVVALKGATTFIAKPDGRLWRHEGGNIGLAISGSGDTLSGIIAGLAARGASLEQACAWGVALHARAGEQLAMRVGPLGYLARDIAAEVPMLMHALGSH